MNLAFLIQALKCHTIQVNVLLAKFNKTGPNPVFAFEANNSDSSYIVGSSMYTGKVWLSAIKVWYGIDKMYLIDDFDSNNYLKSK